MPISPETRPVVTAFRHAPAFAHGLVRDLRVRWALEEIGRPYRADLLDAMAPRPDAYRDWQPFGQVPAFADDTVRLFESGAILLYLGDQNERLLPRDPAARWNATAWLIAALNSVEPAAMQLVTLDVFQADRAWSAEARPTAEAFLTGRLACVADALDGREWLAGQFSIADIMMTTVLRSLRHTPIVKDSPILAAYQARAEARPAFQRALADQIADLGEPASLENAA